MFSCCRRRVKEQVHSEKIDDGESPPGSFNCAVGSKNSGRNTNSNEKIPINISTRSRSRQLHDSKPHEALMSIQDNSSFQEKLPKVKADHTLGVKKVNEPDSGGRNADLSFHQFCSNSNQVLGELRLSWGVKATSLILDRTAPLTQNRLALPADAVLISQSWNKILAFRSMFAGAVVSRWRVLIAAKEIQKSILEMQKRDKTSPSSSIKFPCVQDSKSPIDDLTRRNAIEFHILYMIEKNQDPLAKCLDKRIASLEALIVASLDAAVQSLCPHQLIQREGHRPLNGSADVDPLISSVFLHKNECLTFEQFCTSFARLGLEPHFWVLFCNAFVWAMDVQNPYITDEEKDDLRKPSAESAHCRFVAGMFVLPIIEATLRRTHQLRRSCLEEIETRCSTEQKDTFHKTLVLVSKSVSQCFTDIVHQHAQSESDHNEISIRISEMINVLLEQGTYIELSDPQSNLRRILFELSLKWTEMQIPIEKYMLLIDKSIEATEHLSLLNNKLARQIHCSLKMMLPDATQLLFYPSLLVKNLKSEAAEFYADVAKELGWSLQEHEERLYEVFKEINTTGHYTHTEKELEMGCKLAWRNSSKCIGRIAWDTLIVRDRRECKHPDEIFNEIVEHLKVAAGGSSIQSVMTVFRPQHPQESFGIKIWNSQFVRYAGYKFDNSEEVLGDKGNADFTSYLIEHKLWNPPAVKSAFDVLPLLLKIPGLDTPCVYELPRNVLHEVKIEHPKYSKVKDLEYKWTAVPVISNLCVKVGGVNYTAAPFNGWFVTTEIARNLMERYGASDHLATAFGYNPTDKFVAQKVSAELESAILLSFEKAKYTIVDPETVGNSFLSHCKRERLNGRECPSKWSWIGGLMGPTNPTWHLEMKDFYKSPNFDYCCDPWTVTDLTNNPRTNIEGNDISLASVKSIEASLPNILVAYGSQSGTAESIAFTLARLLKVCDPLVLTLNKMEELISQRSVDYTHILIICSTFGSGAPPSNAFNFFHSELKGKLPPDSKYSVLALGSTVYLRDFCKAGKSIHHKMEAAGARPMVDVTCVDASAGDHQDTALKWCLLMKNLVLQEFLSSNVQHEKFQVQLYNPYVWHQITWSSDAKCPKQQYATRKDTQMRCIVNKELFDNVQNPNRSTRHIVLELPERVSYQVGDHLSVQPENHSDMILRFSRCFIHELEGISTKLGLHLNKPVQNHSDNSNFKLPSSIYNLLCHHPLHIECMEKNDVNGTRVKNHYQLSNKTLQCILQRHTDFSFTSKASAINLLSFLNRKLERETAQVLSSSHFAATTPTSVLRADIWDASRSFINMTNEAVEEYNESGTSSKLDDIVATYPTIVHLLERFQNLFCNPWQLQENNTEGAATGTQEPILKIVDILVRMPRLKSRTYSISSSPTTTIASHSQQAPSKLSITVGVVHYTTSDGVDRNGICSNYLANLLPGDVLNAEISRSTFKPPKSRDSPMILIGAGTGLAPFMGFLSDRSKYMRDGWNGHEQKIGECHLFFGCRTKEEILYKEQLLEWEANGVMKLHLALSRTNTSQEGGQGPPSPAPPSKIRYVQDCFAVGTISGKHISQLLLDRDSSETHLYICGSEEMAKGCHEALMSLLETYGPMSKEEAREFLFQMREDNRLQMDVWSASVG